jgi:cation:H+ antiporter
MPSPLAILLWSGSGVALLYFGAEALVRGGASLGLRFGLSPLVVGLTIVAFGTSAPELAVSVNAALSGKTDLSIGNVVGSNIANVGLVLGLSALIRPISIHVRIIRVDVPLMIGISFALTILLSDGILSHTDGALLFIGILVFTTLNVLAARKAKPQAQEVFEASLSSVADSASRDLMLVIAGLLMLIFGGRFLVDAAVDIARFAGVSEAVLGLTIVAVGTSLPELATSVLAAARGMSDISLGNIVGSNIFNILGILGISSLLTPLPLGNISWFDIGIMLVFSIGVLPLARSGFTLNRWEGLLFLCGFVAYVTWLVGTA